MRLENLNDFLFEKFEDSKIENLNKIVGGVRDWTRQSKDCNMSSYDQDANTGWRGDSKASNGGNDTVRVGEGGTDNCNDITLTDDMVEDYLILVEVR